MKTLKVYRVVWEIDLSATSAREAAQKAREYQQPGTNALVFGVYDKKGLVDYIDLAESEEESQE